MRLFTSFLLLLFLQNLSGQALWQPATVAEIHLEATQKKRAEPWSYRLLKLDYAALVQKLATAPMEFSPASKTEAVLIDLPIGENRFEEFAISLSPVMEPELMAKYPKIRTFCGRGTRDKSLTVRLDHGYLGLHAMVMEAGGTEFYVEPFANGNLDFYMAFDKKEAKKPDHGGALPMSLADLDKNYLADLKKEVGEIQARGSWLADTVTLRSYRLALACTGEYTEHFGGKPQALSAATTAANQLSMVYERDIDIRFVLVAKEDTLVFDNFSDPFSSNDVTQMIGQTTAVINARIGSSAYDVGHSITLFTGGGALGVGGGQPCSSGKGGGSTSGAPPEGNFFVAVLGQEVGHQFSGAHTFNFCNGNESAGTAYEPYCGSTIMSYSTWGPDLYMHNASIEEIGNFSQGVGGPQGNACAQKIKTTNLVPKVDIPYANNFSIPLGTPFDLTATGSDADGGTISYCWEEFDLGPQSPDLSMPNGSCPIFRTFPPVASPTRIFPKLSKIIANNINPSEGEVLPFYGRNLTFRCTVRDNQTSGGGVAYDEVEFKVAANAGPFRVQNPNAATDIWKIGDWVQVKWDVANSNNSPVNCKIVDLKLSLDGGMTYPILLAAGVTNDGSEFIKVPNNPSTKARIMVHAADNVFFDISNVNFKIQAPTTPGWGAALTADSKQICLPDAFQTTIQTVGWQGFSDPISLSVVSGLPNGATVNFSKTTLQAGETSDLNLDFSQVLEEGTWLVTLKAATATDSLIRTMEFVTVSNVFSSLALNEPIDGSLGLSLLPNLKWTGATDANFYDIQLATSPSFDAASVVISTNDLTVLETKPTATLEYKTMYFWRIRAKNECGETAWTEPFVFATAVLNCQIAEAQDLPKNISFSGTPEITSTITAPFSATITDLNIARLEGSHEFFKDLDARLVSPSGTEIQLWKSKCGNFNGNFKFGLDDEAPTDFKCPPSDGQDHRPVTPLSAFQNQPAAGTWTLKLKDQVATGGGALTLFRLEFCGSVALSPPFIINNNVLEMPSAGLNAEIAVSFLKVGDGNNTDQELLFTLVTVPQNGHLALNWGAPMKPGDRFTQTDLNNGAIRFFDWGGSNSSDKFSFVVADGEGGFIPKTIFLIDKTTSVETPGAVGKDASAFYLAPNPTTDAAILTFEKPLAEAAVLNIFDVDGRLVSTQKVKATALSTTIETDFLPSGIYLVSAQTSKGLATRRLAVSH